MNKLWKCIKLTVTGKTYEIILKDCYTLHVDLVVRNFVLFYSIITYVWLSLSKQYPNHDTPYVEDCILYPKWKRLRPYMLHLQQKQKVRST